MRLLTEKQIAALVIKTRDAYSFDRYTSWWACVRILDQRGYNEAEIEAILRSKWMRWAADRRRRRSTSGKASSLDLARFLDDPSNECTTDALNCAGQS